MTKRSGGKRSCKYWGSCGTVRNCSSCKGYKKATRKQQDEGRVGGFAGEDPENEREWNKNRVKREYW